MFILDIIDSYIKKAGFDEDQPRDEKGRWSSEGGANPERIKVLKDYYSKMSVEEIRQNVRLDKEINPVIERWQASSVSLEAYALKAKIIEMEGLDSSGNRGISDTNKSELLCWHDDLYDPQTKEAELSKVMDALLNSDYEEIRSLGRDIMSVTSEYKEYEHEGVKRDLRLYNVRNSLNVYLEQLGDHPLYSENYNKRVTDAAIKIKNDFDRELKVEDKITQHAKEIASDSLYYKLKAAGQVIMEKEDYPEKITLYRGTSFTNTPTDTVVTSLVSKLTTDGKIVVNSDVLSSWTTIPMVAYAFAASGDVGIVQKETIDRKDIFIPASLIRFDKGNEKEHVVINKKPTVEFNTTNAAIVPKRSGISEETVNKFLNFGDLKETELNLTYLEKFEIFKAGFNEDQPRDEKGRWSSEGGGGSWSVSGKHYNEFRAIVDSSPDKYDAYAKIKDIIHTDASASNALEKWKDSSRGPTSTFLKQRISDFEGVRSRDAMRPDQIWWALDRVCKENPEETKTIFKAVMKQTNADNFKNYKSVMRDRLSDFRRTLKNSKEYGDSVKDAVANARREVVSFAAMSGFYRTDKETARMINKVISSPKVASLVKSKVMDTLTKEGYDKIKGATQALLSKENGVQNHVRLYRGYALSNDPKEVLGIIKKVASGDKKISVKEDGISSYTRSYGLAATFLANSKMYSVIERDVPKKDVVIHPGVFKMWSGEEEYTVLNRKASLPLRVGKDIFLDSFDSIASKVTGGLDSKEASDWLSQASKYKDKYEANRAEIAKAGFNEDQPRNEKGMWTSGGGGSGKGKDALYEYHKDQMKHLNPEQINKLVRKKDKIIDNAIHSWQTSSTSKGATDLKEVTKFYENLDKSGVRITAEQIRDALHEETTNTVFNLASEVGVYYSVFEYTAMGDYVKGHWCSPKEATDKLGEIMDSIDNHVYPKSYTLSGDKDALNILKEHIKDKVLREAKDSAVREIGDRYRMSRDDLQVFKPKDREYKQSKNDVETIEKVAFSNRDRAKDAKNNIPKDTYTKLKAAGQLIMEKQNYPEKVTLLRGLTTRLTAKECEKILYSVVNGKTDTDKLRIAVDVLASYTTQRDVAHNFGTSYDGDETMGLVIVRDVPRKDILVPSKLIQYNEGIEKEHIVIHKTPKVDVPLNRVILPNYRDLSGHYDMVTNSEGGNLGRSEMIRDIYNEKVSKHNAEVKKYVRDKGHYRLDW